MLKCEYLLPLRAISVLGLCRICAIAVAARPGLGSIEVAAPASRVRVLNLEQLEIFFPVWTLFRERGRAVADFNPLDPAVLKLARLLHISLVFISRDGPSAQRAVLDSAIESFGFPRFHFGGDEISHGSFTISLTHGPEPC